MRYMGKTGLVYPKQISREIFLGCLSLLLYTEECFPLATVKSLLGSDFLSTPIDWRLIKVQSVSGIYKDHYEPQCQKWCILPLSF